MKSHIQLTKKVDMHTINQRRLEQIQFYNTILNQNQLKTRFGNNYLT